jgi:ABC-type amino acid transport substrate-binding protein
MHTIVGLFPYHTMSAVHRQINPALLYGGIPGLLDHPRNAMAAAPLTRGIAVFVLFGWILGGCSEPPAPSLEVVKRAGKLVVLTRNTPTTYYEGPDGPAGIEYDMAKGFADTLNVELEMVVPESLLPMVAGKAFVLAPTTTRSANRWSTVSVPSRPSRWKT